MDVSFLSGQTDEQLARLSQQGNANAADVLFARYALVLRRRAAGLKGFGFDLDDLFQENMVGFLYAIRTYSADKKTSFRTYALVCAGNAMRSAVKSAARQKHMPLSNYVSLSEIDGSVADKSPGPERYMLEQERSASLSHFMRDCLSSFEHTVVRFYLSGYSYEQTAQKIGSTAKSVDNALQRVRRKLRSYTCE
jgi:RNA polymerase sporulation-specific sigma factor